LANSTKTPTDAGRPRGGGPCPKARTLASVFVAGTGADEKNRVLDHVAVCPECAREFRALTQLWRQRGTIPADLALSDLEGFARFQIRGLKAGRRHRGFFGALTAQKIPSLVAGATLLIVCVAAYSLWKGGRPFEADRVVSPGGVALLSPRGGEILRPSFLFRWSAVEDAAGYTLEVLDSALLPVLTYPHLSETRCAPPAEDLVKLESGRTYFWKVTADLGDLRRVESRIERFQVPD
jgi:hypothetical protein